jgi:HK97 gp10 family phage protein
MIDFSVLGFNDLNDKLAELGTVLGKRATRSSAKKAMLPVLNEIQQTSPFSYVDDGIHMKEHFKLSISGRTKKNQKAGNDTFLTASVKTSNKEVEKYAALVEFGRGEFTTKRTNAFGVKTNPFNITVGKMKANPFMRTAMRKHSTQVATNFCSGLIDEIEKIAKRKEAKERSRIRAEEKRLKGGS